MQPSEIELLWAKIDKVIEAVEALADTRRRLAVTRLAEAREITRPVTRRVDGAFILPQPDFDPHRGSDD